MLCYIGKFEEAVKGRRYESRCDVDGSLIDMHFDATCRMMTLQRALARDGNGKSTSVASRDLESAKTFIFMHLLPYYSMYGVNTRFFQSKLHS